MTLQEQIEILQHIHDTRSAERVECRKACSNDSWRPAIISIPDILSGRTILSLQDYEYRIKPQPIVMWGVVLEEKVTYTFTQEEVAREYAKAEKGRLIKLVEATE